MAYITLAELKSYLDITNADDDTLLTNSITGAQKWIEEVTHRFFEAQTLTKNYAKSARSHENRRILDVDEDLLTITELLNGDTAQTEITAGQYWLLDRNLGPPYANIQLTSLSNVSWTWDEDGWVEVTGTWGFSATADGNIKDATLVLAAYAYRQKDAQIFDTIAIPDAGVITVPQGIPKTTIKRIMMYRKYL